MIFLCTMLGPCKLCRSRFSGPSYNFNPAVLVVIGGAVGPKSSSAKPSNHSLPSPSIKRSVSSQLTLMCIATVLPVKS